MLPSEQTRWQGLSCPLPSGSGLLGVGPSAQTPDALHLGVMATLSLTAPQAPGESRPWAYLCGDLRTPGVFLQCVSECLGQESRRGEAEIECSPEGGRELT